MNYMYFKLGRVNVTEEKLPHHTVLFYSVFLNDYLLVYVIIVLQK